MSRLALYIDEDAMDADLVRGIRSRGIDVLTAAEAGMIRRSDEDHLRVAAAQGRALYSFNVSAFHRMHTAWTAGGHVHAGILLAQQRRYSVKEQLRRIVRLVGTLSAEAIRNRLEFLGQR